MAKNYQILIDKRRKYTYTSDNLRGELTVIGWCKEIKIRKLGWNYETRLINTIAKIRQVLLYGEPNNN